VDIEAFYEQNEARRESAEVEYGDEWTDASGNRYELAWVEDTGELYLMVEPDAVVTEDMFGDFLVSDEPVAELQVMVVATIRSENDLEDRLSGWESQMGEENSLQWLHQRLGAAEVDDD
jgi:hypothetical protein